MPANATSIKSDVVQEGVAKAIQMNLGGCREWPADATDRCNAPAEYVLWGKLLPSEALGPRCRDCASKHVHYSALHPRSGWALVNIAELANDITEAFSQGSTGATE